MPLQVHPVVAQYANTSVTPTAAASGSYGLRLTGGWSSTGFGLYTDGATAFASNPLHISKDQIQVVPSGQPGLLTVKFKLKMNYAYANANYNWFRVTVNGVPIADVNGVTYPRPSTPNADPFVEYTYNLAPYQGSTFILALESCARYANNYTTTYVWGDANYVDDLEVYYELAPGDLQGYVFNYDGLAISGATVAHQSGASTVTGPDGSYLLPDISYGDQQFYCGKEGYNSASAIIYIPSDGVATYDFTLTQPNMVINPLVIEETLNPNEYFTTSTNVLNNGNGPLDWTASVNYSLSRSFPAIIPLPFMTHLEMAGMAVHWMCLSMGLLS